MAPSISVSDYYANKSIFITGATGFMGKVLVEKLLRTCPGIKKIYVLMRAKKGHNSKERLNEYFNIKMFDQLRKQHPKSLDKLRLVQGDILLDNLGISIEDREELQRECNILFHSAACVRLIKPHPNTYGYTKDLAEDLVSQYAGKFAIVIARPSIVTPALKEPMPGWTDNLNGPTGMIVAAAKGVLRSFLINADLNVQTIPVDVAINACILLAYTTAIDKPKDIRVCNITMGPLNPITWGNALELGWKYTHEYPFSTCLWYPDGGITTSWLYNQIAVLFTQILPAYFVDLMLYLLGKKTFMVKVQKRISYGLGVLHYYTMKEWIFKNDHFVALQKAVSEKNNQTYFTDISNLDWNEYIRDYVKGAREYCLNEDPATIPQARKLRQRMFYLHVATTGIIYAFIGYFIFSFAKILFYSVL